MNEKSIMSFTSHIQGKNAKVSIYADRIEWSQPRSISGGKLTAGVMTAGLSLLATGVKGGGAGTEMIPVSAISSVTTKRDGLMNSKVSVITTGNTIDFRVSHSEASSVADTISRLITGRHPAQSAPAPTPVIVQAPEPAPDVMAQIVQLSQLRDAGVLTDAEFSAKKAELLGRL